MFTTGWAAARRRSACRTADVLALKAHNLDATTFWSAPQISATLPQRHRQFCASSSLTEGTRALDLRLLENGVVEHHLLHPLQELARLPEDIAQIQSQRVHPARSAALQWAVSDVATVESVPVLPGKTETSLKIGCYFAWGCFSKIP